MTDKRKGGRPKLTEAPSRQKNLLLPVWWIEWLSKKAHDERVSISKLVRDAVGEKYNLPVERPANTRS